MTIAEKTTLTLTWLVISSPGALAIWIYRAPDDRVAALAAAGLFVAIMSGVCLIGGLIYARDNGIREYDPCISALKSTAIQQAVMLVLSALMLDGGESFRCWSAAVIGYWAMAAIIILRRAATATKLDLFVIRYGLWFVFLMMAAVNPILVKFHYRSHL